MGEVNFQQKIKEDFKTLREIMLRESYQMGRLKSDSIIRFSTILNELSLFEDKVLAVFGEDQANHKQVVALARRLLEICQKSGVMFSQKELKGIEELLSE